MAKRSILNPCCFKQFAAASRFKRLAVRLTESLRLRQAVSCSSRCALVGKSVCMREFRIDRGSGSEEGVVLPPSSQNKFAQMYSVVSRCGLPSASVVSVRSAIHSCCHGVGGSRKIKGSSTSTLSRVSGLLQRLCQPLGRWLIFRGQRQKVCILRERVASVVLFGLESWTRWRAGRELFQSDRCRYFLEILLE